MPKKTQASADDRRSRSIGIDDVGHLMTLLERAGVPLADRGDYVVLEQALRYTEQQSRAIESISSEQVAQERARYQ